MGTSSSAGPPRVGFAVSRRVGGAVGRNLVRRRLRAILRDAAETLVPGAYLVSAGTDALNVSFSTLDNDTRAALADVVRRASADPAGAGPSA